jgi:hypothetical protein
MYSIDGNVRSCVKREEVELDALPAGIKSIRSLKLDRIQILKFCLNASPKSIFKGKKSKRVLNSIVLVCIKILLLASNQKRKA